MTTALVTGSHTKGELKHVFARLDVLRADLRFDFLVTGGAEHIDMSAVLWCMDRKVSFAVEYPDWKRYGFMAGTIRNEKMISKYHIDFVIAFKGDTGTADMKARARARGIKVYEQTPTS